MLNYLLLIEKQSYKILKCTVNNKKEQYMSSYNKWIYCGTGTNNF